MFLARLSRYTGKAHTDLDDNSNSSLLLDPYDGFYEEAFEIRV
jgi:hypothetical protein